MRRIVVVGLINLSWACGTASNTSSDCKDATTESESTLFPLNDQNTAKKAEKDCAPSTVATEQNKSTTTDDPSSPPQDQSAELTILNDVNRYRAMVGLPDATIDSALSIGAQAHAEYLKKNPHIANEGVKAHSEDPTLPGYSEEGAASAKASNIHYIKPAEGVDGWMATLYHRIPLIRPSQLAIGVGHAEAGAEADINDFLVVDVIRGLGESVGNNLVIFPPDGATKVPLEFGPEVPDPVVKRPAGYPLTVTWYGKEKITQVTAKVTSGGKDVPIVLSTPESPATYFDQQNTIMIYTESPMTAHTTYQAEVSYRLNNEKKSHSWSFTTGSDTCCSWKD